MNPDTEKRLVPPRPNLGPEPWSERPVSSSWLALVAIAAFLLMGYPAWRLIRRRRKKIPTRPRSAPPWPTDTPRGQLVAQSYSLRDALAHHFGLTWRAKTIEELALEPRLAAVLDADELSDMIRFLDEVDRLKFAPERSDQDHEQLVRHLQSWQPRLAELERKLASQSARASNPEPVSGKAAV